MAKPASPEAIATWAERQTKPAPTPKYRRLTDDQRVAILQLAKVGKTQVEIAQAVGCDQTTVSRWLIQCQDTSVHATAYLRGSALKMARNIVGRGRASDHIKALEGISVLAPEQKQSLVVQIGIKADTVTLLSPSSSLSQGEDAPIQAETLARSDNGDYVNQAK